MSRERAAGHRRVRAGRGAAPALDDGLHLPRAPRRGDLPVQGPALAKAGGLPSRRRGACPREGGGPALAKAGDSMLPSDFFRLKVVLSFQEDAIGIRLPPPYPSPACGGGKGEGVDNMMW